MARLALALVLALVVHFMFFQVGMVEQEEAQLTLAGSNQVSVRLAGFRPEPVDKTVPEPEPEFVPVVEPEPERLETAEAVEEAAEPAVPQPVKAASEKEIQDVVKKATPAFEEQAAAAEIIPAAEAVEQQQVAESASSVSAADVPGPDGSTSPATQAVRQAEPLAVDNMPPAYPALARRRGWQGTVVLEVEVDRSGLVRDVRIQTSSSYSLLDREARDAVRKWRFTPGSRNGISIESKVLVPVHFMLQDN